MEGAAARLYPQCRSGFPIGSRFPNPQNKKEFTPGGLPDDKRIIMPEIL
jgi:hypothetical protein